MDSRYAPNCFKAERPSYCVAALGPPAHSLSSSLARHNTVEPSSADLFFSFLRHSHSKSRPLSIASATLADTCLAHVPAAELEALDLCAAASLAKAFVASKSAEARGAAAAISRHLAEARGFEAWSAAVASVTKPIEFRDLMAGCRAAPGPTAAPSSVIEEVSPFAAALAAVAAAEAGSVETAAFSGGRGACRSGGEAAAEPVIALSSPGCCVSGGGIGDAAALRVLELRHLRLEAAPLSAEVLDELGVCS